MNVTQNRLLQDAIFVGLYAGAMWVTWWLVTHPDKIREIQMQAYKTAEIEAMKRAKFWADKADYYAKAYDSMRAVTL